jgi:ketosteroid isomerase-like protein
LTKEPIMRRPVILSSMLTLFVVAGVGLIAGSFLWQPAIPPAAASGNTEVIRRFYAAANETIATGDTTALHDVVAPHFVDQDPIPGMNPDRGGLEGYLAALHALVPDTELLVEAVVAGGDRAMARVAVRGGQGPTPLRDAVVDQPVPWGPVDVFRIAGGKVVERWSQTDDLTLVRPVTEATIDLPSPSPRVVSLDRMTFEPDAGWKPSPAGPRLIFVESGALHLEFATPESELGTLPAAGNDRPGAGRSDASQVLTLSAGESSLVPAGARLAMTNAGVGEARVLVASFTEPRSPGGAPTEETLPPGVVRQTLAGGLATDVGVGRADLALAQVTLARNARLSLSSADGPVLIAVETGHLSIGTWGRGWLRRGSDGVSGAPDEQSMARGDGLLMHQGGLATLQIAGDGPAVVHVLTLHSLD